MTGLLAGHDRMHSEDYYRRRATRAAYWFGEHFIGFPLRPFAKEGDLITYDGQIVDVKCVGYGLPTITGHAAHRPFAPAVIVEVRGVWPDEIFEHVGTIQPEQWRWDLPRHYRNPRWCWMVDRDQMGAPMPKPTGKPRPFQVQMFLPEEIQQPDESSHLDDPTGPREMSPKELKYWRDKSADQRRRARVKASKGTGWAFPDDTPRGLGKTRGGKKPVTHE